MALTLPGVPKMHTSRRWLWKGVTAGIYFIAGGALIGLAGWDIYADAFLAGDPLWTTLLENLVTIASGTALMGAGAWISGRRDDLLIAALAR